MCVRLDMDLYKRVLKLTCLYPQLYEDKWIASPGQFDIVLCVLRCLDQTVDGSGLDNAWVEADIYSNVTVMQIINGSHHNRTIECHLFTLQALTDMWFHAFFAKHPDVYKSLQITLHRLTNSGKSILGITAAHAELLDKMTELNIEEMMDEFDSNNAMYKWAMMYMHQFTALLEFLRSTRQHNVTSCIIRAVMYLVLCIQHIKLCSEYSRIYCIYASIATI